MNMKKTISASVIVSALLVASPAYAPPSPWEYWDWDGGSASSGSDFNTAANWQNDTLPGTDYSCYFKSAGLATIILFSANKAVGNLTQGNGTSHLWRFDGPASGGPYTLTLNTDSGNSDPNYYLWNNDSTGSRTMSVGLTTGNASRLKLWLTGNGADYSRTIKATVAITIGCEIQGVGFTKTGASSLTIGGAEANTYVGSIIVTDGTLILNKTIANGAVTGGLVVSGGSVTVSANDQIADASTVNLAGGTMTLTASDTVNALQFDGGAKAGGTWGAVGSSATHQSSRFSGSGILTVSTGPGQSISFGALANKTYGDSSFSVSASASSALGVSFSIQSGPATINGTTVTITGVGTVTVRATQGGNENYNAATAVDQSFTVNQRPVTLSGSRTYDGTDTAAAGILSIGNKVGSDEVSVASGSGTLASRNYGSQSISSFTGLALGGGASGNYTLSGASGSVAISTKALTVAGVTAANKFYDGTTSVVLGGTAVFQSAETAGTGSTSDGKPYSVDSVSPGGTAAGAFGDRNIGTAIAVNISGVTVTGDGSGNYTATAPAEVTAAILDHKEDSATTTITAVNSATFGLTINNGKLLANNTSGSINGTGTITVNSGATLGGSGKVGAVVVHTGGFLAPGASIGTLTVSGDVTLNDGSTTAMEINNTDGIRTADKVAASGAVVYAGKLTLTYSGNTLLVGDTFDLFGGALSYSGAFAELELVSWPDTTKRISLASLATDGTISITANNAPSAGAVTLPVEKNGSATFPLAKYASDPDGDFLTPSFSSFNHGGKAAYANGTVTYTPASDFAGTETFDYTVMDPSGASGTTATVTATIFESAASGPNILGISKADATVTITYAGIPGTTYRLQYTAPSPISWQNVSGTGTTDAGGRGTLSDSSATGPERYYRTKYVSGP